MGGGKACLVTFGFKRSRVQVCSAGESAQLRAELAPSLRGWARSVKLNIPPSLGHDPPGSLSRNFRGSRVSEYIPLMGFVCSLITKMCWQNSGSLSQRDKMQYRKNSSFLVVNTSVYSVQTVDKSDTTDKLTSFNISGTCSWLVTIYVFPKSASAGSSHHSIQILLPPFSAGCCCWSSAGCPHSDLCRQ